MALTDEGWFKWLSELAEGTRLDEVNFWRPLAQTEFKSLQPGELFFFRLKHPVSAIVGYGFFAHATNLPIRLAWEFFEQRCGTASFDEFLAQIAAYRKETPLETALGQRGVSCLIIRNVQFFDRSRWLPWGQEQAWQRNIVAFKRYSLVDEPGRSLRRLVANGTPPELVLPSFELLQGDERTLVTQSVPKREGQGDFRARVLDAYHRRCAVTGEHSLPVLDSAHIQPYRGAQSNHLQNGLVLRADIHRLFDSGYVSVTPAHEFIVSRHLRDDFENGKSYYDLHGTKLAVIPDRPDQRPSQKALEWHTSVIFRG